MLRCSTHGLAPTRGARPTSARSIVTRSGNGATGSVKEGQRVKIIKDIKIFHAPKHPEGLSIQGLEGLLVKNVAEYKSKILSANLPYKVELRIPLADGTTVKTLVHVADDEVAPA